MISSIVIESFGLPSYPSCISGAHLEAFDFCCEPQAPTLQVQAKHDAHIRLLLGSLPNPRPATSPGTELGGRPPTRAPFKTVIIIIMFNQSTLRPFKLIRALK